MTTNLQSAGLQRTVLALALMTMFSQARAEDDVAQLIKPDSYISVGAGALSGDKSDRAIYGQYTGKKKDDAYGIIDIDYVTRDIAEGIWMRIKAADAALNDRELSFSREKQGVWKYGFDYSELHREYYNTINTGMTGVGTTTPVISRLSAVGTGQNVTIGTDRKAASMSFEQWVTPSLQFEANFKNEDKSGARLWGRGYACAAYVCGTSTTTAMNQANFAAGAVLLVPEAIDSSIKQIDAKMNYHDEKLLVSLGYYGSFYNNSNGSMNPVVPNVFNTGNGVSGIPGYPAVGNNIIAGGGMSLQNVLQSPMALAPDNQAHQLYMDGSYGFSRAVKANFKIAYTHASQNDNYAANGLTGAPVGVTSLNARVDTLLTQFGLTARPTTNLFLLANVKYENRDDKTPLARYNVEGSAITPATTPASYTNAGAWNNNNTSSTKTNAKVEASYRITPAWRATVGGDYSEVEREVPTSSAEDDVAGLGALRAKNHESGYRLELRRSMSETLNGSIGYSSSKRSGSDWTSLSTLDPTVAGTTAANLALINAYCNGRACYGQQLSAASILALSANTPFPSSQTDLKRDKWKFSLDWTPTERLNFQLVAEDGKDTNTAPFTALNGGKGWRDSGVSLYSLDANYTLSESVVLNAYASHSESTQHINHSTGYMADLNDMNDTAGIGLRFKVNGKLSLNSTLSYLNDKNKYGVAAASGVTGTTVTAPSAANLAQAAIGLPDATFRQIGLRLAGIYAIQPKADLRIDYGYSRVKFYDWQWGYNGIPFAYSDNTTVTMKNRQNVSDIAVRYIYKF